MTQESQPESVTATPSESDLDAIARIAAAREAIIEQVRKRIIGQDEVIEHLLIALFAKGHCLLMGVPGLAKTLLVSTVAQILDLSFNRIQFTPDLMPSDITGTDILEEDRTTGKREFQFVRGPIFCNLLVADEVNRTPPKTQAALLQPMQEYQVTAGGRTYPLALPFLVFATQNPIEQEGTYPLPEAQLDRFMFHLEVDYPNEADELEIVRRTTVDHQPTLTRILKPENIVALQRIVLRVPAAAEVIQFAVSLARSSRPDDVNAPAFVKEFVAWGAGPRASQYLILAAKSRAVLHGHFVASIEDVRAVALPILRHRIITNFHAEAQRVTSSAIATRLLGEMAP